MAWQSKVDVGGARFCGYACWLEHRRQQTVECACEQCGKAFTVGAATFAKRGARYCGRRCATLAAITPLRDRFWTRVNKTDTCWLWTGSTAGQSGYGVIGIGPRGAGKIYTHRLSYEIHVGPIPEGMRVCHNCPEGDNPLCCNPAHLFLGTDADNAADKVAKGRQTRGESNASTKLTEAQARTALSIDTSQRGAVAKLAREFGVSHATICDVISGRTWKHLRPDPSLG
jgi:hypothetical protein